MKYFLPLVILLATVLISGPYPDLYAQGTTTASMNGKVSDENGEALLGATVVVVHEPTGTEYATVSSNGFFRLSNLRVGGPYTVSASFVGFQTSQQDNIYLELGQTYQINFTLSESSTELEAVEIIASQGIIDGNRTGSETNVDTEAINTIPTVERGLNDFTRLTPQANVANAGAVNSGSISFAGVNNRFNSIFIDGAVNNDVFGLANSGTNGGQAGISPISPDAIEQIQVVLAPYDVTLGGFAGGGINAVTRSGTNEFEGSLYSFFRNESIAGKTPTDNPDVEREKLPGFTNNTYGFRLGGPIIKNKLFFFTNVEIQRAEEPRPFIPADYIGDSDDIERDLGLIRDALDSRYGYDPGGVLNNAQTTKGEKFLGKIDWNINNNNKLSVRHSYVKGETKIFPRPANNRAIFENVGYIFPSTTNSSAIELKTNAQNFSNNLILGATFVRDDRDILGDPFPQIIMNDGNGQVSVGTDNFSYSNIVFQDVFTLTNNFNLYKGKHTLTFGTHNEFFRIQNLFTIFSTPRYQYFFNGINRFLNNENPDLVLFGHEQVIDNNDDVRLGDDAKLLGPTFDALQLAFYAQDEIQFTEQFKMNIGVRLDVPIFLEDAPVINDDFNNRAVPLFEEFYNLQGARASKTPATQFLFSPRVGFNYDVTGNQSTQLRGGLGIFTSRVPWVWPGGQYIRNGLNSSFFVSGGLPIYTSPDEWKQNLLNTTSPSGDVDLFVEDFKYPQVFRTSLGIDQKLPGGIIGTVETIYTKTLNNIDVKSINLRPEPVGNLEGTDNRPIFNVDDPIDPTYTNVVLVDNTNEGYTFNFTASLQKPFENGLRANLSYSFTRAEALIDGSGFINYTNWDNLLSVQGRNSAPVNRSIYDVGSRVTAFLAYRKEYLGFASTTISIFYNGQSGQPYSYVYNDNEELTNQSTSSNNRQLIYVPAQQSDINLIDRTDGDGNVIATAQEQWEALDEFIENDEYLSDQRGDYAEANLARTPFEGVLDLKVVQDFFIETGGKRHTLQLTFDIFNFTNLINKDWGRRYFVPGNTFPLINFQGFEENSLRPQYTFSDPGEPYSIVQSGIYSARWSGQFGVRYYF